jgi:hypothetical protein
MQNETTGGARQKLLCSHPQEGKSDIAEATCNDIAKRRAQMFSTTRRPVTSMTRYFSLSWCFHKAMTYLREPSPNWYAILSFCSLSYRQQLHPSVFFCPPRRRTTITYSQKSRVRIGMCSQEAQRRQDLGLVLLNRSGASPPSELPFTLPPVHKFFVNSSLFCVCKLMPLTVSHRAL